MASKVCCDEVKVSSTIDLNDRDYLNDLLYDEKGIVVNTATALTEASNDKLKEVDKQGHEIGNHSATHHDMANLSKEKII